MDTKRSGTHFVCFLLETASTLREDDINLASNFNAIGVSAASAQTSTLFSRIFLLIFGTDRILSIYLANMMNDHIWATFISLPFEISINYLSQYSMLIYICSSKYQFIIVDITIKYIDNKRLL